MDQAKTGLFIAQRRRTLGMTQQELADRLGVTDKAVSKWERGLSYPDITLVSPLADVLGTTERALLSGEEEDAPAPPPARTSDGGVRRRRLLRAGQVCFAVYTAALLLAVFICMLCDLAINHTATWSPVVLASCALAWGAAAPFYYMRRRKLLWCCLCLSLLLPVLLAVIQACAPVKGWLVPVALPITAASLALVWAVVLLHTFTPMNKWTVAAVGVLLCAPLDWFINRVVLHEAYPSQSGWWDVFNWIFIAALALALFLVGRALRRRREA